MPKSRGPTVELILALSLMSRVVAVTAMDTVHVDLNPLIDPAARYQCALSARRDQRRRRRRNSQDICSLSI